MSPLTQRWHLLDVNLTRLASDIGRRRQKYHRTVHKYIFTGHISRWHMTGFNFTGECKRRTLRDWSRSSQHGNVIFIDDTNFSFIYLTIILCAAAQRAHWLKVSFYIYISCFFCAAALKQRALFPAIRRYLIWQCCRRTHLVLAWFRTGEGGAIVTMFSGS